MTATEGRTVALLCTDGGQHGPRLLAELAVVDGQLVDRRLAGAERTRQAYLSTAGRVADFDRRCPACGRNPRRRADALLEVVTRTLAGTGDTPRVEMDVSRPPAATLF